jgi:hypothetical protein
MHPRVLNRREFLIRSAAASALAVCPPVSQVLYAGDTLQPYNIARVLFDRRFARAVAFGLASAKRGVEAFPIDDDAGSVWMHEIAPLWQMGTGSIAGLTRRVPLFCLELLGRDYGMRVVYCEPTGDVDDSLFSWVIAPVDVGRALACRRV